MLYVEHPWSNGRSVDAQGDGGERARLKKHEKEGRMQPDSSIVKQLAPMFSIKVSHVFSDSFDI